MKKFLPILLLGSTIAQADFTVLNRPITVPPVVLNRPILADHAFGALNVALPSGAQVISEEAFKKAHSEGKLVLVNSKIEATNRSLVLRRGQDDLNFVRGKLDATQFGRMTKPARDVQISGRNYIHKIVDNQGKAQEVETMGQDFVMAELASSLKMWGTKENQLGIYNILHSQLPKTYVAEGQVLDPARVAALDVKNIDLQINKLVVDTSKITNLVGRLFGPPAGFPASCDKEIGYAANTPSMGDQTGNKCAHHPDGIFNNINYPLKWYATCVKNQGKRGTCVSFAATSATESAWAVKNKQWVNLSEQSHYNRAKMTWYPSTYGDGLNTAGIMEDMVNKNYRFPYEAGWDYNPSYSRIKNDDTQVYTNSCNNYSGEHCSNTNHQGQHVCSKFLGMTYCGYMESVTENAMGIKGVTQIWGIYSKDTSVAIAKLASALKIPMVMALPVTPSFDNAPVSGYAQYVGSNEDNRGWHAVAVLGVVENKDLPATAPQGAGGGYFIVKNSRGACWKDAGYIYLPIQWVKDYVGSLTLLTSI